MKAVSDGVAFMASLGNRVGDMGGGTTSGYTVPKPPAPQPRAKDDSSLDSTPKATAGPTDVPVPTPEPLLADDTQRQRLLERRRTRRGRMKTVSDGVAQMAGMIDDKTPLAQPSRLGMVRENSERIADLVFMDTDSLRQSIANKGEQLATSDRESRRESRKKSNSDGVSDMRDDTNKEEADQGVVPPRRRRKSKSAGVAAMAFMASPPSGSTSFFNEQSADMDSVIDAVPAELAKKFADTDQELEEKNADSASMRSLASGSGYYSDLDDVPDVDPTMLKLMTVEVEHHHKTLIEKAREYFLSKRYPVMSHVFGTMIAFFIVGNRIERFLHTENIVSEEWISFDFGEKVTFWAFTGLVLSFILVDVCVFISLGFYHTLHVLRERKVWVATLFDLLLCAACLTVFYVAEHYRCCVPSEEDYRMLADNDEYDKTPAYDTEKLLPAACACPAFGSRLHGGLGNIEPYISLIALRLIRFWTASRIVKYLDKKRGTAITKKEVREVEADIDNIDPFAITEHVDHGHGGHDDHGHGHHGYEEKGTIAELWETAVGDHPEIVAKYGEFSGELLQAMLGIPILDPLPSDAVSPGNEADGGDSFRDSTKDSYFIDDQYCKLDSEAQEIIMAGKLGKAVVSFPDHSQRESTFTIHENGPGELDKQPLRFTVSDVPVAQDFDHSASSFDFPNARLVRSMRRCERRMLPILDRWSVVDVVITRFEIVYFDAVGVDEACPNTAVFEALSATKGGKGLRLCDVAAGRRVVGHLSLSEITAVHVEREMPTDEAFEDSASADADVVKKTEYWQQKSDSVGFNRRELWHKIKQDRLVAETAHGHTLYLRFFSDFEDAQSHPEHYSAENEERGDLYKDNAFQWVQTISRMVGPEQLKQALPHFGDDTNDELRDFLVVHRHEAEVKGHRRGLSRGFASGTRLDLLGLPETDTPSRKFVKRGSSFGENLSGSLHRRLGSHGRPTSPGRHNRSGSGSPFRASINQHGPSSSSGRHNRAGSMPNPKVFGRASSMDSQIEKKMSARRGKDEEDKNVGLSLV